MKKLIVAGISMVALATAAQPVAAADLPVAYRAPQSYVIFTWTGSISALMAAVSGRLWQAG
jgi:hypothetical protein